VRSSTCSLRWAQRHTSRPRADLIATLLDAHRNALALRVERLRPYSKRVFWLRAGGGAFTALLWDNGAGPLYVRPETWLHLDGLNPGRVVLTPDAEPGERLGGRLLRPSALRGGGLKAKSAAVSMACAWPR
jgi:hypothetical protein